MESDLRCNRLSCRRVLTDKAVVTTCSHIFCVDCANNLFSAAQICPACEAPLAEPDDVVIASLRPTNDYKTSVLSGLSPAVILEICGRAIAFWQYQIHQEASYQQAILKSLNDKNTQLAKQLENIVREANGEFTLLNNKVTGLERELELERRKNRDMQGVSREKDKEYQKLKNQFDKLKRKALLGTSIASGSNADGPLVFSATGLNHVDQTTHFRNGAGGSAIGEVADGMDAHRVQRTPINAGRTVGFNPQWHQAAPMRIRQHKSGFGAGSISDNSEIDVENILGQQRHVLKPVATTTRTGYINPRGPRNQRVLTSPPGKRTTGGFRPASFGR